MGEETTFGAQPERLGELFALGLGPEEPAEPDTAVTQWDLLRESPGSTIGPYKLLWVLGEGGMGIVYLARQEHPIQRQVALKCIKPGMDSARVIARFHAEQQALALMEHPHIARVYDAGLAPSGRPYFVMEYVEGVPLTEHCDRQELTVEQRLHLFLHVCKAVQHAHQKGIIHRDLKPSNILVVIEDDEPVPKIIDFGIARALSQPVGERTLFTEQGQLIGTPEYMSPEVLDASPDIDTRADIYSLGLILYELIAGVLPFDPQTFRSGSFPQIRQILCEQDPPTPSTRLGKTSQEQSAECARRRGTDARTLRRKLHGELDWITLKALEKDRTRRYDTADGLARDIERYLRDEPVTAGPPSRLYRFRKLVQRNRGVFAGVTAVIAALALGLVVSAISLVREQQTRRQSQAQAYASDMSLAQQALAMNDLGRARRLLEAHRPAPGELDLRGWEWRYLWQQCRSDALAELCRYPRSVYSVAYSPDGKLLGVAGFPVGVGFVEVWDVPTRQRRAALQAQEGHLVAFAPRGDLLASAGGNQIHLWQTATMKPVRTLTLTGPVQVLTFSPDGGRLASLSHPDEATVWETDQWTVVRRFATVRLMGNHQGALDFSPDGKTLVLGDADHHLRTVDLAGGSTIFDVPDAHSEPITCVAWSPNGSVIASGSGFAVGGPIRLWDAASGEALGTLEGHTSWICELVFSADGLRLYSASGDQTIRIWDVGQRLCLATLRGSTDEVYGLALAPDATTLASASKDGVVAFWEAWPHPEEDQPKQMMLGQFVLPAFASGSRALALPQAGTVRLLDLTTSEEIEQLPSLGADISLVAYSPDGTLLLGGSQRGKIRVWSCAERRLLAELDQSDAPIYLLHFRADGRRLLAVDAGGKAIWWDTLTWQTLRIPPAEVGPLVATCGPLGRVVSPDSRLLVVGSTTGALRWLNAETGELLAATTEAHRHPVVGIAFSEDGALAASVAEDGTLAIWDPSSFRPIDAFKGHMLGAHGAAFSPDGRRLVTGGGVNREAVKLWDLSTRRELMRLPGEGSEFLFVAFSPDGHWLAACSWEGNLHLWRAPSWEEIKTAEQRPQGRQSP